jgi:thymidine kinase
LRAGRRDAGLLHVRGARGWHRDFVLIVQFGHGKLYTSARPRRNHALLQASHNYEERGMRTLLYTAQLDSRQGGRIHSRIGIEREARHFQPDSDLREEIAAEHARDPLACVLVDEAQFLTPPQVKQLGAVVDELSVPVLCYGLRTDFRGELFAGSAQLLAWADNVVEIKTICHCGSKAIMVVRVKADGSVERGAADRDRWHECYVRRVAGIFASFPGARFRLTSPTVRRDSRH